MLYPILVVLLFIVIGFEFKLIDPSFFKKTNSNNESFTSYNKSFKEMCETCPSIYSGQYLSNAPDAGDDWRNDLICEKPIQPKPAEHCLSEKIKNTIESFTSYLTTDIDSKKPIMWIYVPYEVSSRFWDTFFSRKDFQKLPPIYNTCLETIQKHNSDKWNIVVLRPDTVLSYIDFPLLHTYPTSMDKTEFIKWSILEKYGGLWVPYHTISINGFNPKMIDEFYYNSTAEIVGGPKGMYISRKLRELSKGYMCSYKNSSDFTQVYRKLILENNPPNNSNIDGHMDFNSKTLKADMLFAQNMTILADVNKVDCLILPLKEIETSHKYNVYLRLSKDQLLSSNMWVGSLLRTGLRLPDIYTSNSKLQQTYGKELKRSGDHELKWVNGLKDANEYWNHPNFIVTKSTTRNT